MRLSGEPPDRPRSVRPPRQREPDRRRTQGHRQTQFPHAASRGLLASCPRSGPQANPEGEEPRAATGQRSGMDTAAFRGNELPSSGGPVSPWDRPTESERSRLARSHNRHPLDVNGGGSLTAPPSTTGSYGCVVKLQISVSPKPTGQSSTGFGASASAAPSCRSIRHSLIAGQTVALRASFHTVTP